MTTALSVFEYSPGRSKVPYDVKSAVFEDTWAGRKNEDDNPKVDGDAGEDASTGDEKKDCAALLSQPDFNFRTCFSVHHFWGLCDLFLITGSNFRLFSNMKLNRAKVITVWPCQSLLDIASGWRRG